MGKDNVAFHDPKDLGCFDLGITQNKKLEGLEVIGKETGRPKKKDLKN